MPRLKILVSGDRSKNCAAMRKAPIRSPLHQAARILSVLLRMPFTGGANIRTADLAWLDQMLDGFVRNIRASAVTSGVSRRCPLLGVKRTSAERAAECPLLTQSGHVAAARSLQDWSRLSIIEAISCFNCLATVSALLRRTERMAESITNERGLEGNKPCPTAYRPC
jgi:hypothetical protein